MNLLYADDVVKTPAISRCVELMDPYFEGELSTITSGLRSPTKQLQIIIDKARRHGIDKDFKEFQDKMGDFPTTACFVEGIDKALYWWQRTWSKLLFIGDIVNPPVPAECLFDYIRPGSNENKKGQIIQVSPHQRGLALDIGGGTNLTEKAKRVMKASQAGNCFIHSFLIEKINNAVHVDTVQIG